MSMQTPAQAVTTTTPPAYQVVRDGIPKPLTAEPGDAARGRAIVLSRQTGLCLLCHSGPFPEDPSQGTVAPDLAGAGSRWTEAQLRLRIADSRTLDPATVMPSYFRDDDLTRVGAAWRGKTILTAQQVEDVVAFLRTLRSEGAEGAPR
ncbi:MAG: sulfur oxidation c-type cytochrome SoxX [Proteobacteria bacterium]|nr:sulfur oxidation c-type cytochrome SoxX [Pseudomonadota bacterium]